MLFIDESQIAFLEDMMWDQGFLDTKQMAGAFQLLRSNDLVWSKHDARISAGRARAADRSHRLERRPDAAAVPHALANICAALFLENQLTAGRYAVDGKVGRADATSARRCSSVATETDHIAPWRSVYKVQLLTDAELTFLLTNGGHNAGIVSEPGHRGGATAWPRANAATATSTPTPG